MPRIVGIIAEYNPFHLGHAHHLAQAKKAANADYAVVVMSTCFTQRGEPALLSPADRARMALSCGADAVFALPAVHAVRNAEHFALGGVTILDGLGCDAISFGSETDDSDLLHNAARLLETPDEAFSVRIREYLQDGIPHPAAMSKAMEDALPGAGRLLDQPNSTLAVCYLRALIRIDSKMTPYPIRRSGSYHATALEYGFPSATAVRSAVLCGNWLQVEGAIPADAFPFLQRAASAGRIHRPAALDAALLYRLRTMSGADYAALPEVSEGIEYRLHSAAETACTRADLLDAAKTRRYPHARLSRLATHALLGLTDDMLRTLPPIDSAWLLGFRQDASGLISHLAANSRLQLLTRSSELDVESPWFAAETRAQDLWALGAGLPAGLARTQGLVII